MPNVNSIDPDQKKYSKIIPALHSNIQGQVFSINSYQHYNDYIKENQNHPGIKIAKNRSVSQAVLNYINGKRSISEITECAEGETLADYNIKDIAAYFDILKDVGWTR